jgi:hypothetical protein
MSALAPVKAAVAVSEVRVERPEAAPVREAVRADLAPAKTVTAAAPADASRAYNREILVDPQTREVIMRVIDEASKQVVRQVPEKALLRLRAYLRAERMSSTADEHQSDRSA